MRPRRWILLLIALLLSFGLGLLPPTGRPALAEEPDCPPNHPVIIDPGHGGMDGGAAHGSAIEKDLVLDIGLRLRDELQQRQIPVLLTRATDIRYGPPRADLNYRVALANRCKASLYLSIHHNAASDSGQRGFMVFYGAGRLSRDAAILFDRALREAELHSRQEPPIRHKSFLVLNATHAPALLLELGFLTNPSDRERLQQEEYRAKIAEVLADAASKIYRGWIE